MNRLPATAAGTGSAADALADALRDMICRGELADGARLVERDLAERFAVSRVPMREAIQRLEHEGLVQTQRHRGAVVRTLHADDVRDIYALRMLLEGDAIERAVSRIDDVTLARAERVHRQLGEAGTAARQHALNREFHEILYGACGNARQVQAIRDQRIQIERYERLQRRVLAETPAFQHEHETILRACRARDGAHARAMTEAHLASARDLVLRLVARGTDD